MRPASLLRLYPPAWRARYGDEFLALAGAQPLNVRQTIDIMSGALDAWLTADVRRAARPRPAPAGGPAMLKSLACAPRSTTPLRDGLTGAAVMIGASLLLTFLGVQAKARGWETAAETLLSLSFPAALTMSLPFWLMASASRRAQFAIVGLTLAILSVIGGVTAVLAG